MYNTEVKPAFLTQLGARQPVSLYCIPLCFQLVSLEHRYVDWPLQYGQKHTQIWKGILPTYDQSASVFPANGFNIVSTTNGNVDKSCKLSQDMSV